MKRLLVLVFACALGVPAAANADPSAQTSFRLFNTLSGDASFQSVDSTGCIADAVSVLGVNGSLQIAGPPTATSRLALSASRFDLCASQTLFLAAGSVALPAGAFVVSNDFRTATLRADVRLFDFTSQSSVRIQIDLAWQSDQQISDFTHDKQHLAVPDASVFEYNFVGFDKLGAASGTVITPIGNLTPDPAFRALLSSQQETVVEVSP